MDSNATITDLLNSPTWWFTGVFWAIGALIIARLVTLVTNVLKKVPRKVGRGIRAAYRLRVLRRIKRTRFDNTAILVQCIITYSLTTTTILVFLVGVLYSIAMTEYYTEYLNLSAWERQTKTFPVMFVVYFTQVVWMFRIAFWRALVRSRKRIKVPPRRLGD